VLPQICAFMVNLVAHQPQLMRLLYFAALELPGSENVYREHLGPVFDAISGYLARCVARGVLQDLDPSLTTLGLFGMVVAHTTLYELFTGRELPFASVQDAVSAYSGFWERALLNPEQKPGVALHGPSAAPLGDSMLAGPLAGCVRGGRDGLRTNHERRAGHHGWSCDGHGRLSDQPR
jgi:hypothetical protein